MTNEEWLCQLSAEEKAKWIDVCVVCGEVSPDGCCDPNHCIEPLEVIEWLKQERSEK
jgi:hypothetical protein